MATVLERFNHLGLAHSKQILSKVGEIVSARWDIHAREEPELNKYKRSKSQLEDQEIIIVNDYHEEWNPVMDRIILEFMEGLRNG